MPSFPTGGFGGVDAIWRKLTELENRLKALATSTATVGKAGTIGTTRYYSAAGNLIAMVGDLTAGRTGFQVVRSSGLVLFQALDGFLSRVALFDGAQRELVSDDPFVGGLSRPRLPVCIWDTASQAAATTSATYVFQQLGFGYQQAPAVRIELVVSSSLAGTTGTARVLDPLGVVIGTVSIAAGVTQRVTLQAALPSWPSSAGSSGDFTIQALRNAGTGTVSARGVGAAWGAASYDTN